MPNFTARIQQIRPWFRLRLPWGAPRDSLGGILDAAGENMKAGDGRKSEEVKGYRGVAGNLLRGGTEAEVWGRTEVPLRGSGTEPRWGLKLETYAK